MWEQHHLSTNLKYAENVSHPYQQRQTPARIQYDQRIKVDSSTYSKAAPTIKKQNKMKEKNTGKQLLWNADFKAT